MSRFVWGNTDGKIWVNEPYIPAPFIMDGITPSDGDGEKSLTIGNIEPQDESFTIDWGDGTITTFTSAIEALYSGNEYTHTYSDYDTEYTVTITGAKISDSGTARFINYNGFITKNIIQWGEDFVQSSVNSICNNLQFLETIPDSWYAFQNVTDMSYAFNWCTSLVTIPNSWKGLENVTDMSYAFYWCTSLATIPNSWKGLENVTNVEFMFQECTSLVTIGTTDYDSLSSITNCLAMLSGCTAITSDILALYAQLVTTATSFNSCFTGLLLAENYASIPDSWKGL